ncbi:MAG: hypothetical protein U0174_01925 [Polyangiaceae bacterium]
MNIDRKRFLVLAASLAAATAISGTTGCASSDDAEEGATDEDLTGCINSSAAGTSYVEGTCFDIARYDDTSPTAESKTGFDDSQWGLCIGVRDNLRQPVANAVHKCMKSKKRGVNRTEDWQTDRAGNNLDWTDVYNCIGTNVKNTCYQTATKPACERIIAQQTATGGQTIIKKTSCMKMMTAVKPELRPTIEACAIQNAKDRFGADYVVYSCMESLQEVATGSCKPGGSDNDRLSFDVTYNKQNFCETLYSTTSGVEPFVEGMCRDYEKYMRGPVSKRAMDCLYAAVKKQGNESWDAASAAYSCMRSALRETCHDTNIDAQCKAIVDSYIARVGDKKQNAGGRMTKQCRAFMNGLNVAGRSSVERCFKLDSSKPGDLWSCVESIGNND